MSEVSILAIVGSLRTGSVNAAVARAAASTATDGVKVAVYSVADVPLYNGDIEDQGMPESVVALHDAVAAADGILLFSPEYNGSFPAVTKNVIDWLSRPPKAWEGQAISLVATSPGGRAGQGVRDHFSAIMARQPVRLFETMGIGSYGDKSNEHGELIDPQTGVELADFVTRFAEHCTTPAGSSPA
jgi:chromate reductase